AVFSLELHAHSPSAPTTTQVRRILTSFMDKPARGGSRPATVRETIATQIASRIPPALARVLSERSRAQIENFAVGSFDRADPSSVLTSHPAHPFASTCLDALPRRYGGKGVCSSGLVQLRVFGTLLWLVAILECEGL